MAREIKKNNGPESAKPTIWSLMKKYLFDQRGEIGVGDGEGGEADGGGNEGDWNVDGELGESEQITQPADADGSALPIKKPEKAAKAPEEEGQEPKPGEGEDGEPSGEGDEGGETDVESLQQELTSQKAQIEQLTNAVNWYQAKLNERAPSPQPGAQGKESAQGTQPTQGQEGVLEEPPEAWEDTKSVVQYFDKRTEMRTQKAMKQVYSEFVQPEFDRMNNAIHSLINRVVKPQLEDYDDVMKNVYNELFVLDPTGQNIVGHRNPAMLEWFRAQDIPILAMYDYGLSKRAPKKIAEGIKKGTKEALTKMTKKPKAPVDIKGRRGPSPDVDELDWDTPSDRVEKILEKKRLL